MRNLCLDEGQILQVEIASLQVATYSKFQPQSTDFLDITNPKAVYPFTYYMLISVPLLTIYAICSGAYKRAISTKSCIL